ncbi:hypothetical protein MKZ38_007004 [Zalerion maritima]|uniref:Uncharacterized protein n=1 Tax=Zalerion maritima TaxID=339359 RepID=A0AAD5RJB7_9PEZI|nr:hypothetical protein MKZ38_007004 [Zalerion maritima]
MLPDHKRGLPTLPTTDILHKASPGFLYFDIVKSIVNVSISRDFMVFITEHRSFDIRNQNASLHAQGPLRVDNYAIDPLYVTSLSVSLIACSSKGVTKLLNFARECRELIKDNPVPERLQDYVLFVIATCTGFVQTITELMGKYRVGNRVERAKWVFGGRNSSCFPISGVKVYHGDGKILFTVTGRIQPAPSPDGQVLAFLPDSRTLAVTYPDWWIRFCNTSNGTLRRTL